LALTCSGQAAGLAKSTVSVATASNCPETKQWNAHAIDLYKEGRYKDVINIISKEECKWNDYELLFSSYMVVYLKNPNEQLRKEALASIAEFRGYRVIDGMTDPGPLYVALWDIPGAKSWYTAVDANIPTDYTGSHPRSHRNMKAAAQAALRVLDSKHWTDAEKVQLLSELAMAIDASVKQSPAQQGSATH